jgi:hypothetical protein
MTDSRPRAGADSPPLDSSPPTNPTKPPSKVPLCKWCMTKPARKLQATLACDKVNAFCSMLCASYEALRVHDRDKVQWCAKHQAWTRSNGRCLECIEEREKLEAESARIFAEKGVKS